MIQAIEFRNQTEEITWIQAKIQELIANHHKPSEIGIIATKHENLEILAANLNKANIPISYERKNNVLKQPHIQWLILILRFVASLNQVNTSISEELLPSILALPFFEVQPATIFNLAVNANTTKESWLKTMLAFECTAFTDKIENQLESQKIQYIANYLLDLGKQAQVLNIDQLLDLIMGNEMINDKKIDEVSELEN